MPRPTRKRSTLQKIARRGFAFSGTTRGYDRIFEYPRHNRFVAYRHGFVLTKDILRALISTFGKGHTTREARSAFDTALQMSLGYSNTTISIKNGELIHSFENTPVILYTFASYNFLNSLEYESIRRRHRRQVPYDDPLQSRTPFKFFEITSEMIEEAFFSWKKKYNPTEEQIQKEIRWRKYTSKSFVLDDMARFNFEMFLHNWIYKKFLVQIIREYRQEIGKRRVRK
jgi:hypothetical protein